MDTIPANIIWLGFGLISGIIGTQTIHAHNAPPSNKLQSPAYGTPLYYTSQSFDFIKAVDGDTIDIVPKRKDKAAALPPIRIRLHGIDTPERGHYYYSQAASELRDLCKGQTIRLKHIGDGKFGRVSANVYCGKSYVNAALIQSGAAITAIKYADDPALYKLQDQARQACKGIWGQDLRTIYAANRLQGRSLIMGSITLTAGENCLTQTQSQTKPQSQSLPQRLASPR